jgi:hypothetical protein
MVGTSAMSDLEPGDGSAGALFAILLDVLGTPALREEGYVG